MTYNDPQVVHSGRCATCDAYTPDNEDLSPDGLCDDCETEARLAALADAAAVLADAQADYVAALAAAKQSPGVTDWLKVAGDIVGVGR